MRIADVDLMHPFRRTGTTRPAPLDSTIATTGAPLTAALPGPYTVEATEHGARIRHDATGTPIAWCNCSLGDVHIDAATAAAHARLFAATPYLVEALERIAAITAANSDALWSRSMQASIVDIHDIAAGVLADLQALR